MSDTGPIVLWFAGVILDVVLGVCVFLSRLISWVGRGKSCAPGFPLVSYLTLSLVFVFRFLLMSWVGYGLQLYRLFTEFSDFSSTVYS